MQGQGREQAPVAEVSGQVPWLLSVYSQIAFCQEVCVFPFCPAHHSFAVPSPTAYISPLLAQLTLFLAFPHPRLAAPKAQADTLLPEGLLPSTAPRWAWVSRFCCSDLPPWSPGLRSHGTLGLRAEPRLPQDSGFPSAGGTWGSNVMARSASTPGGWGVGSVFLQTRERQLNKAR